MPETKTILVLEDDGLLAMDMEDFLLDEGYAVLGPFSTITRALEALEKTRVDFAVVDLNLNGLFSFPVIDALQERGIPLIVCSGYAELPEIKARLSGLPLLPKPWNAARLSSLIETVFIDGTQAR